MANLEDTSRASGRQDGKTFRIHISRETVNELVKALQKSYKSGDVTMVKRLSALLGVGRGETVEAVPETLGIDESSVYRWPEAALERWTPPQTNSLAEKAPG